MDGSGPAISHAVPDSHGINLFTADPALARLASLYLPPALHAHLVPQLERLAFGKFGLAAPSHRGGVLGWPEPMPPAAKYLLTFLF